MTPEQFEAMLCMVEQMICAAIEEATGEDTHVVEFQGASEAINRARLLFTGDATP